MKIHKSDKLVAYLALLSGLTISAVAIYYSVAGLVSIFAAAAIPIICMGMVLETSKLVATVWLKQNWTRAPLSLKWLMSAAVIVLMVITSMGIFGFLSKAHLDQSMPTGDIADKVAVIDEKIATERENVNAARKALAQMDASVNETLSRSNSEQGADKAVAIRRTQSKERAVLQNEISQGQKRITVLNDERAPIAKELRKVEAEVGPIKYIAKLVYGDNPDTNILEKAVTWVILIIVSVFDPLAVILLLASQYSFGWIRQQEDQAEENSPITESNSPVIDNPIAITQPIPDEYLFTEDDYDELNLAEQDYGNCPKCNTKLNYAVGIGPYCPNPNCDVVDGPNLVEQSTPEPAETIVEDTDQEEDEILDSVEHSEKEAMKAWKQDHPNSSLKLHKRLFDLGKIDKLPWDGYLEKTISDEEAAQEAARWAAEQLERPGDYLPKTEVAWMENQEGQQVKKIKDGYQQNAEQSERTLWQRIQDNKNDK